MNIRTRKGTVTFDHPFHIGGAEGVLPAGTYRVAIDEEQLLGLSFVAYRRVAMMLQTPAIAASQRRCASLAIDAAELDAALLKDKQQSAEGRETPSSAAATEMGAPLAETPDATPISQPQPHRCGSST